MAIDQREALIAAVRAQVEKEKAAKAEKLKKEQEAMAMAGNKESASAVADAKPKHKTLSAEDIAKIEEKKRRKHAAEMGIELDKPAEEKNEDTGKEQKAQTVPAKDNAEGLGMSVGIQADKSGKSLNDPVGKGGLNSSGHTTGLGGGIGGDTLNKTSSGGLGLDLNLGGASETKQEKPSEKKAEPVKKPASKTVDEKERLRPTKLEASAGDVRIIEDGDKEDEILSFSDDGTTKVFSEDVKWQESDESAAKPEEKDDILNIVPNRVTPTNDVKSMYDLGDDDDSLGAEISRFASFEDDGETASQKKEDEALKKKAEAEKKKKADIEAARNKAMSEEAAAKKKAEDIEAKRKAEALKKKEIAEAELKRAEEKRKKFEEAERRANEMERRIAEAESKRRAAEAAKKRAEEAEAKRIAEEEKKKKLAEEREKAAEEARKKAEEEARARAKEEALKKVEEAKKKAAEATKILEAAKKAEEEAARRAEENRKRLEEEAKKKALEEAERKAHEEAERKAREEAERKAREEAERKAREEAERKAREEAERKAAEEARKAEEEAAKKAAEEARKKALEAMRILEEAKKAEEEALRKAEEAKKQAIEEEKKALEEAKKKALEEEKNKALEEEKKKALEEEKKKAAEEEAKKKALEEEKERAAEEARKKVEQENKAAEEEAKKKALEAKRLLEEAKAAEEAALKAAEEADSIKIDLTKPAEDGRLPLAAYYLEKYSKLETRGAEVVALFNDIAGNRDKSRNVVLLGDHGFGLTVFGEDFARSFYDMGICREKTLAKIKAQALNKVKLADAMAKLKGGCMVVENAGLITPDRMKELMSLTDTNDVVVILTGEAGSINRLFDSVPAVAAEYSHRLDMCSLENGDMLTIAKNYISQRGFKSDDSVDGTIRSMLMAMESGNIDRMLKAVDDAMLKCENRESQTGKTGRKYLLSEDFK